MSLEFKEDNLIDLCELVTDGSHHSPPSQADGYYMASVKDMGMYMFNYTDCRKISQEDYEKLVKSGCSPKNNDILIAKDGSPLSNIFIYKEEYPMVLLSSIAIIRTNENKILPKYLKYYLQNPSIKKYIQTTYTSGSVIPRIILKDFKKFPINYPNIENQNRIINILETIDKKIEVNENVNKNLFNIASSFQTDWMINFTPFKSKEFKSSSFGLIPEDWNVGKLGEVIELLDSKRVPLSGQERENMEKIYPYYGAASLMDYVDDYIFDGIYLLMGEDGTVIDEKGFPILQYVWGKFWVNNHAHILKGKNGFNVDSLYLLLSKTNIQSIVTGAVQAKVNQSNLKSIEIIIPPVEVMNEFNELIKPFFDAIRSNHDEIEKLQKLRDTLLPKLMSGEIDVSKINCDLK